MKKITCSLVLLALLGLGMVPSLANAQGDIVVYFDVAGTQRSADSNGGGFVQMFIYGDGFPGFVSGAQYKINYGSSMTFVSDGGLPPVAIGSSNLGISVGFGLNPKPGAHFLIHSAFAVWNTDCVAANVQGPTSDRHPDFPEATPIVTRFPDQAVFPAGVTRSMVCPVVELDIKPGSCPNPININRWEFASGTNQKKGGVIPMAILGSASVDVSTIDAASLSINGVAPTHVATEDVATSNEEADCCEGGGGPDGHADLVLKFSSTDVAATLAQANVGAVIVVTVDGAYLDGLPFSASDCMTVVGNSHSNQKFGGSNDAAGLGDPMPNPFNPVTRISYNVPVTQHVSIAIYDVAGRLVESLVNETKSAGEYVVEWDAGRLPSGVYFYRMQAGSQTIVRRATLLK